MIEYTRLISDTEEKLLLNDLLDIKEWIDLAIAGKINSCLKRAAQQYDKLAIQKSLSTVPTQNLDKANALFEDSDYKNRIQRGE